MTDRFNNPVVSILEKPKDERTEDEIEKLVSLIKNIEFFAERNIREKYYPEIVACLKLQRFNCDEYVFHKGMEGKHFFIILEGSVNVCLPNVNKFKQLQKCRQEVDDFLKFKSKEAQSALRRKNTDGDFVTDSETEGDDNFDIDEDESSITNSRLRKDSIISRKIQSKMTMSEARTSLFKKDANPTTGKSKIATITDFEKLDPVERLQHWEEEPDLLEIATLERGASFGEVALIEDKPRGASIKCRYDCIFATMEREDYSKTLSRIENRNINKIIDFFKDLPYFSSYGRAALDRIRFQFVRIKKKRKHVVYKEGDPSQFVYIILKGEFELVKKFRQIEEKEINYKRYVKSNMLDNPRGNHALSKSEVDPKIAQFSKNKSLSNNNEYNQQYQIALLCKGQMFGDQDTFFERPYTSTVICRSNDGELYRITRENFQKLKNHGDCWKKITSKYVTQESLHHKWLKNQKKFNSDGFKKDAGRSGHTQDKNVMPYTMIAQKSPYLRQFIKKKKLKEIDKREILKEIVKDYTKALNDTGLNDSAMKNEVLITDKDIHNFQNVKSASPKLKNTLRKKMTRDNVPKEHRASYIAHISGHSHQIPIKSSHKQGGYSFDVAERIPKLPPGPGSHSRYRSKMEQNVSLSNVRKKSVLHPTDLIRRSIEDNQEGYHNTISRQSIVLGHNNSSEFGRQSLVTNLGIKHQAIVTNKRNTLFKRDPSFIPVACTMSKRRARQTQRISTAIGRKRNHMKNTLLSKKVSPVKLHIQGRKDHNGSIGNMSILL
ncbi:unnamed protein product [Moneuplotes crassus]|uniref:Cyclic nucleotide-binding domain-containing protein n=1 Tax=Euplotes crassus TaxID=5936 RepID=A0AAD1XUS5_EUPCR|nr:unnamed protein product [Moneuplotes crassus]